MQGQRGRTARESSTSCIPHSACIQEEGHGFGGGGGDSGAGEGGGGVGSGEDKWKELTRFVFLFS